MKLEGKVALLALCSPTAKFRYVPLGDSGIGSVHKTAAGLWQLYMHAFPDFSTQVMSLIVNTTPLRRLGCREDIANVIAFLLSNQGSWSNGQIIHCNNGIV